MHSISQAIEGGKQATSNGGSSEAEGRRRLDSQPGSSTLSSSGGPGHSTTPEWIEMGVVMEHTGVDSENVAPDRGGQVRSQVALGYDKLLVYPGTEHAVVARDGQFSA